MRDPVWLKVAREFLGQKEVAGLASNDWIMSLWQPIPWIWSTVIRKDDSVLPWCGAFVRLCLIQSNLTPPKAWYRASAYAQYGHRLYSPVVGCIAVLKNTKGQHHVGFVVGKDNAGNVILLGGNQDNQVKLSAFKPSAFISYCWPNNDIKEIPLAGSLPILSAALSVSEA